MLITDKNKLTEFTTEHRIWQGIPAIEVTKNGKIFSAFYSGGTKETLGNFAMVVKSDNGTDFTEPITVAYDPGYRCFDPCLWIDPLDRLWFIWSVMPEDDVYATICCNPDDDNLIWSEPKVIGKGIMMNKPTILSTGEWIFPIALWSPDVKKVVDNNDYASELNEKESGAFVYRSIDQGETFEKISGVCMPNRSFDEHMILEFKDGRIGNYVRTTYGIGVSYSYDGLKTWSEGKNSRLGGPCSRFYIGRLKSGRILLINHHNFKGRNNLCAFLSEDDGATWPYRLMLDERDNVSYPDVKEANDGFIYVAYDRERGAFKKTMDAVYNDAREILYARITEEDIINGKICNPQSKLRCIISKLGRYKYEENNPFNETQKLSDEDLVNLLMETDTEDIPGKLFDAFSVNCMNMQKYQNEKLDNLIEELQSENCEKKEILLQIISLIKSITDTTVEYFPVVDRIKEILTSNLSKDISIKEIAEITGISQFYMMHMFKKATGSSINKYKTALKIIQAKKLLINTSRSITDIATECGFNSISYFSDRFIKNEGVTPSEYRKLLKI